MSEQDKGASFGPGCEPTASAAQEGVFAKSHPSHWHKRCSDCVRLVKNDLRHFCVMNCSGIPTNEKAYI